MKTSEFRSKVEEMGYLTTTTNYRLRVYFNDMIAASIMRDVAMLSIIDSSNFDFIKLCIEYAETPIEEREEVKKKRSRLEVELLEKIEEFRGMGCSDDYIIQQFEKALEVLM